MKSTPQNTGEIGEKIASEHLLNLGFEIVERNKHIGKAEIDILAKKDGLLVAVEVKTRSSNDFGNPQDFVKPKQIKNLVKAVDEYVIENDLDVEVRFDVIAIIMTSSGHELEHLQNAFYHF